MIVHDPRQAARGAVAAHAGRPATAIIHDSPDARLVVFRIEPGQRVPPHTSASTVILTVVAGSGTVTGGDEEREVRAGDVVTYAPAELHGMEAAGETLVIVATIAPRPGLR
jgi:quercetin dioxygenase-like cupin family protein